MKTYLGNINKMEYRNFGKSSVKISEIGLGTEYLTREPAKTIFETVGSAIDAGINYIDILFAYPPYLQALGQAIESKRNKVHLAVHIGAGESNGKHRKIRNPFAAKNAFKDVKRHLDIDYVDIAIIQNVTSNEYSNIMKSTGLLQFAKELKDTQQAKFLGISVHNPDLAQKTIETGEFDVLMSQFNLLAVEAPKRQELIQQCHDMQIAFVAIKPYAGGELLKTGRRIRIPSYKSGSPIKEINLPKTNNMPIRCLAYILKQRGVTTVIPGVKNTFELHQILNYYAASEKDKDFIILLNHIKE